MPEAGWGVTVIVNFYQDENKQWRWQLTASDKQKVADSADGYEDPADAVATFEQTVQCDLRLYSKGWRSVRHRHFNRIFVEGLPRS